MLAKLNDIQFELKDLKENFKKFEEEKGSIDNYYITYYRNKVNLNLSKCLDKIEKVITEIENSGL